MQGSPSRLARVGKEKDQLNLGSLTKAARKGGLFAQINSTKHEGKQIAFQLR